MRELTVVRKSDSGRTVRMPADRAGDVEITRGAPVWVPSQHPAQRSITTYWWAATTRDFVGCRSLARLSTAMLLDFNPNVVEFSAWTGAVEWRERGRTRQLVPDFFVRTADGATVVVDCPPATGPAARWDARRAVLREACEQAGWQTALPRLPGVPAMANLRWVSRYRHPRNGGPAVEWTIRQAFDRPRPLAEGVEACGLPRLTTLPRLYHMLWNRKLGIDWSVPLGPASVVGPARGEPTAMHSPFGVED